MAEAPAQQAAHHAGDHGLRLRILAMTEQEAGLAGQISVRSERPGAYWTLRFGLGFDEATPDDFIEVDRDLNTLTGDGMPNPRHAFPSVGVRRARTSTRSSIRTRPGPRHWPPRASHWSSPRWT